MTKVSQLDGHRSTPVITTTRDQHDEPHFHHPGGSRAREPDGIQPDSRIVGHGADLGRMSAMVLAPEVRECETSAMGVSVLDREMYSEAEAARLLQVPQNTLNYWLEGGKQRGRQYKPVIREQPRGGRAPVTWAEFIEAGLLREYRRTHGVPMAELRAFIDRIRQEFGVPYPLADRRPYVSGKELLSEAQDAAGLAADFCLVAVVRGQYVLTPPADSFYKRVTWDGDLAAAWRPHDDPHSPVLMRPGSRSGRPAVKGISTEIIWEHAQTDETVSEIASEFDLTDDDVRWALAYENSARAA